MNIGMMKKNYKIAMMFRLSDTQNEQIGDVYEILLQAATTLGHYE